MHALVARHGPTHRRRRTLAAALAAALVVPFATITGASASNGVPEIVAVEVPFPTATGVLDEIVVVHGIPDVDVDVVINGTVVISDMSFTEHDVLSSNAGSHDIQLVEPGTSDVVAGLELLGEQLFLGVSYTVAAYLDADGNPTLELFENDVMSSDGDIEVFHLADFPDINILADGDAVTGPLGPTGGPLTLSNGESGAVGKEGSVYTDVGLALAGETTPVVSLGDVTVSPDSTLLLYAVGPAEDDEPEVPVLPAAPELLVQGIDVPTDEDDAEIVVVHGVPDLDVDVLVDGDAVISGFSYGDVTITRLEAGTYDLGIAAAGSTEPLLELEGVEVGDGESFTVAAYLDEDGDPTLAAFVNETDATGIQVFHLAEFPAVAVLSGESVLADPLASGETVALEVDGGETVADVGVALAGSTEAAIEAGDITVPDDTLLLVFAVSPEPEPTELPFSDIEDSIHLEGILAVYEAGIVRGFGDGTFGPQLPIRRDQMASFLAAALELEPAADDPSFSDTVGNTHEGNIGAIAAAGVTQGLGGGLYGPELNVGRDQMASFLAAGFDLEASDDAPTFADIAGNTHESNIRAIAEARITGGVGGGNYGPDQEVTRGQMATFIARALGLIDLASEN